MVFGGVMVCIKLAGERLLVLEPALKDNWGEPESGFRKWAFRLNPGIGFPKIQWNVVYILQFTHFIKYIHFIYIWKRFYSILPVGENLSDGDDS